MHSCRVSRTLKSQVQLSLFALILTQAVLYKTDHAAFT